MKSLSGPLSLVTILLFFIGSAAFAQGYLLVGTTNGSTNGGDDGYGAVYKMKPDGSGLAVIHSFNMVDEPEKGYILNGGVIQGSDKFLYGTTRYGGIHDKGTIFKLRTDGTGFTKLHDFDGAGGADPHPGLIEGEDGTLYGMTTSGGPAGIGVIFKISPSGTGFQVLKGFLFETGGSPRGSLLQGSNEVLYGTGFQSGEHDLGSLFSINTDGSEFKVLHHFVDSTGSRPNASLIEGSDGRLYGTGGSGVYLWRVFVGGSTVCADGASCTICTICADWGDKAGLVSTCQRSLADINLAYRRRTSFEIRFGWHTCFHDHIIKNEKEYFIPRGGCRDKACLVSSPRSNTCTHSHPSALSNPSTRSRSRRAEQINRSNAIPTPGFERLICPTTNTKKL